MRSRECCRGSDFCDEFVCQEQVRVNCAGVGNMISKSFVAFDLQSSV